MKILALSFHFLYNEDSLEMEDYDHGKRITKKK